MTSSSIPFGIDLGNSKTVVSCFKNAVVDIVINEESSRSTKTLVAFDKESRYFGQNASTQALFNLNNTVGNLKRILGVTTNDPQLGIEREYLMVQLSGDDYADVNVQVQYEGIVHDFIGFQLVGMFFNKLKSIALLESDQYPMTEVCVSVPMWYNQRQRVAIINACSIAQLKPITIINELTAAAVCYADSKYEELLTKSKTVAIIDIGHSSYQVVIAEIRKDGVKILGSGYDKNFGGRVFDYQLALYIAKRRGVIFDENNQKVLYRTLLAAEKLKKVLSANNTAATTIDSLVEAKDVYQTIKRDEFENILETLLKGGKLENPIEEALKMANVDISQIDNIEVIGGSGRIPFIRSKLTEFFGKPLSATLNQDESIATGNAFIGSTYSQKSSAFKVEDITSMDVEYQWKAETGKGTARYVIPRGHPYPSDKPISTKRTDEKASIKLDYDINNKRLTWLVVDNNPPVENQQRINIVLVTRIDSWGIHNLIDSYKISQLIGPQLSGNIQDDDKEEDKQSEDKPMKDISQSTNIKQQLKIETHRKVYGDDIDQYLSKEQEMVRNDEVIVDTLNSRNNLETYINEFSDKLDSQYEEFITDNNEKDKLVSLLEEKRDWLYNEPYGNTKKVYDEVLASIKVQTNPIEEAYKKEEDRKRNEYLNRKYLKTPPIVDSVKQQTSPQSKNGTDELLEYQPIASDTETKTQQFSFESRSSTGVLSNQNLTSESRRSTFASKYEQFSLSRHGTSGLSSYKSLSRSATGVINDQSVFSDSRSNTFESNLAQCVTTTKKNTADSETISRGNTGESINQSSVPKRSTINSEILSSTEDTTKSSDDSNSYEVADFDYL
ncbi:heat shock protein 70 [Scheffersomyces coipomensis]|uniref:heat shock protein 70 n=1 Tax=Scheffersomyces coipomensis TaxID=1788519 RepID=UPI00315CB246